MESSLAGGIGQSLHPAMEGEPTAVEDDLFDAGGYSAVTEEGANGCGHLRLVCACRISGHGCFHRRGRGQGMAGVIVDQLGVDMVQAAIYRQTGAWAVPAMLLRTRWWRRIRATVRRWVFISLFLRCWKLAG